MRVTYIQTCDIQVILELSEVGTIQTWQLESHSSGRLNHLLG